MNHPRFAAVLSFASTLALSIWLGGLVVLGAVVAPIVFRVVHAPTSADAMTLVFSRFDSLKVVCALAALVIEVARIRMASCVGRLCAIRGIALLFAASLAITGASLVTPVIAELHHAGAVRYVGPEGQKLERFHRRAEAMAKAEVWLLLLVFGACAAGGMQRERRALNL